MKFPVLKGPALVKMAIGLVAGIVVIAGGFLLVQNVFTKAADSAPRDLIITDITTNTVKIAWTTDQETQGVVEYGASPTSLNLFSPENQKQKSHNVEITLLSPGTSYYFQIRIGESKYDNGGVPWTFSTKVKSADLTGSPLSPSATPSGAIIPTPVGPTSASAFGPLKSSSLKVNPTGVKAPTAIPLPTTAPIISTPTPGLTSFYCTETDCQQICIKMKTGQCSTQDLQRAGSSCVGKVNLYSCYWITPTVTPTITPTASPTSTPTVTPTPTTT